MTTSCGTCAPCRAKKACANVVRLDKESSADASKLWALVGRNPPAHVELKSPPPAAVRARVEKPEPMVDLVCVTCGETFRELAYLADYLSAHGRVELACHACRLDRQGELFT